MNAHIIIIIINNRLGATVVPEMLARRLRTLRPTPSVLRVLVVSVDVQQSVEEKGATRLGAYTGLASLSGTFLQTLPEMVTPNQCKNYRYVERTLTF